jgi:hypothetical protein
MGGDQCSGDQRDGGAVVQSAQTRGNVDGLERVQRWRCSLCPAVGVVNSAIRPYRSFCRSRFGDDCDAVVDCRALLTLHARGHGVSAGRRYGSDDWANRNASSCKRLSRATFRRCVAAWREWRFTTLSIAFALGLFAQVGLFAHLFSLLVPALGDAGAGASISLVTLCAVLGRTLLGGLLPAHADRRVVAAANFAVQVAGSIALLAASGTSVPLLLLGCVLFGLGVGRVPALPPLIAQIEFNRDDVQRVVTLVTAANQAVFAFAPAALGILRDVTAGGWAVVLAVGLVQMAAAGVVLAGRRMAAGGPTPAAARRR